MIRKLIILFLFAGIYIHSQTEFVEITNPVYAFIERLEAEHYVTNYNSFELPKTRKEIAELLGQIDKFKDQLNSSDRLQYEDLLIEFTFDISGSTQNSISLTTDEFNLFSEKAKYFFFNSGKKGNLFISLLAESEMINQSISGSGTNSAYLFKFGGQVRGTVLDKFGFFLKGTNGQSTGDKKAAYLKQELKYNLKFNEGDENYFDETEGYFTIDFDAVRFKIGRDRINIGEGTLKPILNSYSPSFDYVSLNIKYDILNFSFFHGKLLGNSIPIPDSIAGGSVKVIEKYLGYHRLALDFSKHLTLGAGEMIVYGDRPLDLTYLNPFNFYKSVEHSNRDRDNSLLFFDITNNSIKHLKLYSLLLIDDVSFRKLNSGWWGNQFLFNGGLGLFNINNMPLDIRLEYQRIEPYTFTHRLSRNSYTNYNYNLGTFAEPNSELLLGSVSYRFTGRIFTTFEFYYYIHGANPLNQDGSIKTNVGGDILTGHRTFDSIKAPFLAGDREYVRKASLNLRMEPINQILFLVRINYINESLQNQLSQKSIESFINLSIIM